MAGKWRRKAREASSRQKAPTILKVDWVTGSDMSPPGGETAPTMVTAPSSPPRVMTLPARS